MAIRKSSSSGIPFGNTANRPANPAVGQPYFNGQENRLELYTQSVGWQNIVAETPGVVSYTGSILESNATNTLVISGTHFTAGAIASLIGNDGTEYVANTTTVNSIVQITAVFGALAANKEPYDIKVINPSNLYGILPDTVSVNDTPSWTTSAGSLGTFNGTNSVSVTVAATDEENNSITYSLLSGLLPGGLSLNSSTGVISGTATNPASTTTYSFTINASDGLNTAVSRNFSITIDSIPEVNGGTLTSDSTYFYRTFTQNGTFEVTIGNIPVDVLVIAGGGGGGSGWYAGGGGAGGVKLYSNLNLSTQNYAVVVGLGGNGTTDSRNTSSNGGNSSFATSYTATGGGGGGSRNQRTNGQRVGGNGGSGGGAAFPSTLGGLGISVATPTPVTFQVTNSGSGAYLIDGVSSGTITLTRGGTYTFNVNASGHPFYIQTTGNGYNSSNVYSTGVTGAGAQVGTVTFTVPSNAPDTLYYQCQYHSAMYGQINIISASSGEGFDGGSNTNGGYGASGGGAGGVGSSGTQAPYGSDGGPGTNAYSSWLTAISSAMSGISGWLTATSTGYIAGGGAAGTDSSTNRIGGIGGGGNGAKGSDTAATNGIANTGSGGGGGSGTESNDTPDPAPRGATGGSGLVIIRYTKASVGG